MMNTQELIVEILEENERKEKIINENRILINALLEQLESLQN